ncbi:MAG: sigma-70 family RNA polymerase sigma factor, partial [Gammaproteobacteria bacterium]|nr:sigma-70 family RNA polymerase sigma factor [Gammaproteobacteria bacterium]
MSSVTALMDSPGIAAYHGGDDRELTGRARDGDVAAFEQLYRRHVGRIHAVCLRLAGNRALAEECTQDVFVQAWQALAGFRGDSGFGSWLHRIAVNAVLERHRHRLRQAAWMTPQ